VPADAKANRITIATRIIELARRGVIDASELRDRVVIEARSTL